MVVAKHDENAGHASAEIAHQATDKCIDFLHISFLHSILPRCASPSPAGFHAEAAHRQ
ncbi:hypothetical protein J2T08_002717 [Neorhizobium galegae]|nr:hypothetical protein [Neorhizobium galegae]